VPTYHRVIEPLLGLAVFSWPKGRGKAVISHLTAQLQKFKRNPSFPFPAFLPIPSSTPPISPKNSLNPTSLLRRHAGPSLRRRRRLHGLPRRRPARGRPSLLLHLRHSLALSKPPVLSDVATWSCPDCFGDAAPAPIPASGAGSDLVAAIRAIESDKTLSEQDKARRRQAILAPSAAPADSPDDADAGDHLKEILDTFNCVFCLTLPERPVTVNSCIPWSIGSVMI
jgi:hypothetical protein